MVDRLDHYSTGGAQLLRTAALLQRRVCQRLRLCTCQLSTSNVHPSGWRSAEQLLTFATIWLVPKFRTQQAENGKNFEDRFFPKSFRILTVQFFARWVYFFFAELLEKICEIELCLKKSSTKKKKRCEKRTTNLCNCCCGCNHNHITQLYRYDGAITSI